MWVRRAHRCEADLRIRLAYFFTQSNLFVSVQVNINQNSKIAVNFIDAGNSYSRFAMASSVQI